MVRISYSAELAYDVRQPGADFLLNIQAARTTQQRLVSEHLELQPPLGWQEDLDPSTHARVLRLQAGTGLLVVRYRCTVDLHHVQEDPARIPQTWIRYLPVGTLPYLYPSRFCESDVLGPVAQREFGHLPQDYRRVQAIRDWVQSNISFVNGSSGAQTSAAQTLASRQGVCRDFAHLMIALCRALNIPARFTTGFDYGADPALGPTDFHAYVEVYLGQRWYLLDPSGTAIPMGLVRLASGRDAADCAYATIFGDVAPVSRWLTVEAVASDGAAFDQPAHSELALSTADA
ncbi:MAG TPA: transglutaminase family protein [Ramlibacter sp.]|nr:transglutaminase family protein [Ramlibacter sp.]